MSAAYLFLGALTSTALAATVLLLPWPGLSNVRLALLRVLAAPLALMRAVPAWVWALGFLLVAGWTLDAVGRV